MWFGRKLFRIHAQVMQSEGLCPLGLLADARYNHQQLMSENIRDLARALDEDLALHRSQSVNASA